MAIDIAAVLQSYNDNADWEATQSVAKARAYITACRKLIGLRPTTSGHSGIGTNLGFDVAQLRAEIAEARAFVDSSGSGGAAYVSFEEWRT